MAEISELQELANDIRTWLAESPDGGDDYPKKRLSFINRAKNTGLSTEEAEAYVDETIDIIDGENKK